MFNPTTEIRLHLTRGLSWHVKAELFGQVAVHGTLEQDADNHITFSEVAFSITHVMSGYRIGEDTVMSLEEARSVAQALAGIDMDTYWLAGAKDKKVKAAMKALLKPYEREATR